MSKISNGRKVLRWLLTVICIITLGCTTAACGNTGNHRVSIRDAQRAEASTSSKADSTKDRKSQSSSEAISSSSSSSTSEAQSARDATVQKDAALASIPAYSGSPYVAVNNNVPFFTDADLTTEAFESYSDLDNLGRCGVAYANVCQEIMPTEKRGAIGSVRPSGWHTVKYQGIDGNYLYNRCHLIGYQLSAENANEKNLITGTRYLNVEGMLPFENMVADYVKESNHHVLYRVTPVFDGNNLLASGVLMEAESVEDQGAGVEFNVYCYNVQPGITIDYADGSSSGPEYTGSTSANNGGTSAAENAGGGSSYTTPAPQTAAPAAPANNGSDTMVWVSTTGRKYHSRNNCGNMNPAKAHQETESQAIAQGLEKCKNCW